MEEGTLNISEKRGCWSWNCTSAVEDVKLVGVRVEDPEMWELQSEKRKMHPLACWIHSVLNEDGANALRCSSAHEIQNKTQTSATFCDNIKKKEMNYLALSVGGLMVPTEGSGCRHTGSAAAAQPRISTTMAAGVFIPLRRVGHPAWIATPSGINSLPLCTTLPSAQLTLFLWLCPNTGREERGGEGGGAHPFVQEWTFWLQLPRFDVRSFCYVSLNRTGERRPRSSWLLTKQNVNHRYIFCSMNISQNDSVEGGEVRR